MIQVSESEMAPDEGQQHALSDIEWQRIIEEKTLWAIKRRQVLRRWVERVMVALIMIYCVYDILRPPCFRRSCEPVGQAQLPFAVSLGEEDWREAVKMREPNDLIVQLACYAAHKAARVQSVPDTCEFVQRGEYQWDVLVPVRGIYRVRDLGCGRWTAEIINPEARK